MPSSGMIGGMYQITPNNFSSLTYIQGTLSFSGWSRRVRLSVCGESLKKGKVLQVPSA
jgi:hypothetical protein